jgi:transcription elongation factor Elf1
MLEGDPTNIPVYGMTAMDEIMFKTPDALFSGESVVSVVKSCIPAIKDPWQMPQLDIDSVLIAIRIATYGQKLQTKFKCTKCNTDNESDFDLSRALEYFAGLTYSNHVYCDPLTVKLRPYSYKEFVDLQLQTYELRRMLQKTIGDLEEKVRTQRLDEFYKKLGVSQSESFKKQILAVEADDTVVNNPQQINDWINNSEVGFFDKIKNHLEEQRNEWKIQDQKIKCAECEHENNVAMDLDASNFFVKS